MGEGDFVYSGGGGATSGVTNPLNIPPINTIATPTTGINFSAITQGGMVWPAWTDLAGSLFRVQPAIWGNTWGAAMALDGSTPSNIGDRVSSTGTIAGVNLAGTNRYTRTRHNTFAVAAAINSQAGWTAVSNTGTLWRGNAAGLGGFFYYVRCGMDVVNSATNIFYAGVSSLAQSTLTVAGGVISGMASSMVGLGKDTGDATLSLFTNNAVGPTTKTAIPSMPAFAGAGALWLDFWMYCKPNDTIIYYRVDDLRAGSDAGVTLVDASVNSTLPVNTTFMAPLAGVGSGPSDAGGLTKFAGSRLYFLSLGND
jgi:hypothetical protein